MADRERQRPLGWALSLAGARRFVAGDEALGVRRRFVGDTALIDRALVTPATSRGLLLVGEPGTAKSLLSELIAAAVSGTSTPRCGDRTQARQVSGRPPLNSIMSVSAAARSIRPPGSTPSSSA